MKKSELETWRTLQQRALEMRKNPTESERMVWKLLRNNKTNLHFRRQHVIGRFIVDFVCLSRKLVIEIDGDIHDYQKLRDRERSNYLRSKGFEVIRYKNSEVLSSCFTLPDFGEGRPLGRGEE